MHRSVISGSFLKIQNLGFSKERDLRGIFWYLSLLVVCFLVAFGKERERESKSERGEGL